MTTIDWDIFGRTFEAGLDRAVLYTDAAAVPWSGFVSLDEVKSETTETSYYLDGVKYTSVREEGEYAAKLTALTYPDEFAIYDGYQDFAPGISLSNQPVYDSFNLSYRTLIGNGIYGLGLGYKIHLLYNLFAIPEDHSYHTLSEENDLTEFTWSITAIPDVVNGFRPTAHIVIDSRKVSALFLFNLESILYGNSTQDPRMPEIVEVMRLFSSGLTKVTDYGNGIAKIEGSDASVFMTGTDTFKIVAQGVTPVGDDTYSISDGQ